MADEVGDWCSKSNYGNSGTGQTVNKKFKGFKELK